MLQNTNKVVTNCGLYFAGNKLGVFKSFMHKNILYQTFSPLSLSLHSLSLALMNMENLERSFLRDK